MSDTLDTLHELCETVDDELAKANEKIRKAGGELTAGDVDYLDKLTHMLKSIKTTAAMLEYDDGGYSNRGGSYARDGRSYGRNGSYYGDMSYAGRRNARRDSMGRYSRDGGYSMADSMESLLVEMRDMLPALPDDKRRKAERLLGEMERM